MIRKTNVFDVNYRVFYRIAITKTVVKWISYSSLHIHSYNKHDTKYHIHTPLYTGIQHEKNTRRKTKTTQFLPSYHGAREAEGWRQGLGVLPENEPEVDVEHLGLVRGE